MNALFHGKRLLVGMKGILMLCIFQLSFLAVPVLAQEQGGGELDSRKVLYGFHLGFTENKVDIYHIQSGEAHALEQSDNSFYATGFRLAVMCELRLGRYFSLRAMPGVTLLNHKWEPDNTTVAALPSANYKVESVCGELPVDVKFRPFRFGDIEPYLTSGLSYRIDFASLSKNSDTEKINQLNAHDLRYTCGLGMDWYMHYISVGLELKASFGLLSPNTGGSDHTNPFYFHPGPTFSIGLNLGA